MTRSGYSDDVDALDLGRWRGQVASAIRGKRGQEFLKRLVVALDAMPVKELVADDLVSDGSYCALGAYAAMYSPEALRLDPEDLNAIGRELDIARQLVAEVVHENDDMSTFWCSRGPYENANRWRYMREWAESHIKKEARGKE